MAVLVDRSRDPLAGGLVRLEPDDRYHVTDNRAALRAAVLARHGVLVIAGHSPATYSAREMAAIVQFVRRGGGLLLAASAGVFERYSGRGVAEMAVAAVARRFGVEYLSPAAAAGGQGHDADLVAGYEGDSIRVHSRLGRHGVGKDDVWLKRWSPVRAAKRAAVLISHRKTGEAAAVSVPFGRGRVVAVGSAGFVGDCHLLSRRLIEEAFAGPRRRPAGSLPHEIAAQYTTRRVGSFRIRCSPLVAERVDAFMRIARKVCPRFEAMTAGRKQRPRRIELTGACTSGLIGSWGGPGPVIHLGTGATDAGMAYALGGRVIDVLTDMLRGGYFINDTVLGRRALSRFAGLLAMRWAGFAREADELGDALERESRRRFAGLDAGWLYSEYDSRPGLWIWRELSRRCGDELLGRFVKAIPKKFDRRAAPRAVFTDLDVVIHFLSRAAKADLYPYFAAAGATVHPLGLSRFGSKAFKQGVRRYLRRRVTEAEAPASERADAVEALLACQRADKRTLSYAARQLSAGGAGVRLVGAARMARARDRRGPAELARLAGSDADKGLAAVAALLLLEQGRPDAAGRLATLARSLDRRFQLEAGHQLARIGHPAAARFSLSGIARADGRRAAGFLTRHRGALEVYPIVNGQPVANIFSADLVAHMPCNTHVSMFFLYWVHCSPKFRRRGLTRLAMSRSMNSRRARRCSCAALDTGTRNVAHALYRSFGFVDVPPQEELTRELTGEGPRKRVRGVKVIPYRRGDERAMARLFNACYAEAWAIRIQRATVHDSDSVALLARRGRKLAGYVTAQVFDGAGRIREFAVAAGKHRQETAAALLAALHRRLERRGAKKVTLRTCVPSLAELFQPMGYRSRRTGGVGMFGLLDLPRFLTELRPLLEHRLRAGKVSDWCGTVSIVGQKHRAALKIDRGRVEVLAAPPAGAEVTLTGGDLTVTRIVGGIETPFEAYLQLDLRIRPTLNDQSRGLLEALFPRLEMFAWLW